MGRNHGLDAAFLGSGWPSAGRGAGGLAPNWPQVPSLKLRSVRLTSEAVPLSASSNSIPLPSVASCK